MKKINKLAKFAAVAFSSALLFSCATVEEGGSSSKVAKKGKAPKANIELIDWYLSVPTDNDGNGKADLIKEKVLAGGYTHPDFFYRASDGGYVFKSPTEGTRTSLNTRYTRVELREMLRRGDTKHKTKGPGKNNWVFGTAPSDTKIKAGGVNGVLEGTLAVNHVTTKGKDSKVGRVIVSQIHAAKHEPIRLYYRKMPNNTKGSIYFVHEPRNSEDVKVNIIGTSSKKLTDVSNPDGIELDEVWSYRIETDGNEIKVTIIRAGKPDVVSVLDISESGYDSPKEYMYFKAGAYVQDDTPDDYAQVTYYRLDNSHDQF